MIAQRPAAIALTETGLGIGERLRRAMPQLVVFGPKSITAHGTGAQAYEGRLADHLPRILAAHDAVICVMALGIVVRLLGPLLGDKARDPAVVVVDEAGRFAISVLGGHRAGANELARRIAEILGAAAVITTASDALGLPAVDLIGQEFGWKIEDDANLTALAAAVVNGRPIAVYQDAGEPDWWQPFGPWPDHFRRIQSLEELDERFSAGLVISDRAIEANRFIQAPPSLVLRPRTLCVGIGCRRGAGRDEIESLLRTVFQSNGLSENSIAGLGTAWLKADEPALVEFARALDVPLHVFSADELESVGPLPTPSEQVFAKIGLRGVAEAAAMRMAGTTELVVPKQASSSVTLAVARRS